MARQEITLRGRKQKQNSRATEMRQRLILWQQMPKSLRPSLRSLARELGTSHTLLQHYLDGLERWKEEERQRKAKLEIEHICARAQAENRPVNDWEEQRIRVCDRITLSAMCGAALFGKLERLRQKAKRGELDAGDVKILKLYVRWKLPGAQQLLEKYPKPNAPRHRKTLEDVVGKLTLHLDAMDGFLWLEDGQIRYFVPNENALARALLARLYEHRTEVKRLLERWTERLKAEGRYEEIRAKICQHVSIEKLIPLDSIGVTATQPGNSAKPGERV